MIRKQRPMFTSAELELQLQQISLDSAATENLEALAPLIKSIQDTDSEQLYLKSLDRFVEEKEREIETICEDNYEDFVSSVLTLSSVRHGTGSLRKRIGELDGQMGDVGRALGEKKRALLEQKKVARNMDDAIETLQTCLRLLDLVHRVGDMIRDGKYWGALRMIEDLSHLPPPAISNTPFYLHLISSLPSLRLSIKDAVTASTKSWLFDIRESSALVGDLALQQMGSRIARWRAKKEKDPGLRLARIGGALELVHNERVEHDALNNSTIKIDFRPLFQCIRIYEALDCKAELQRKYQEDRKTQADLIMASRSATTPETLLVTLPELMKELVGFFIIEAHVLRTCPDFRSQRDVDDLWDEMCRRIIGVVSRGLKGCSVLETFAKCKESTLLFVQTLESHGYDITELNSLLMTLFERYSELLLRTISSDIDQSISNDDLQPMLVSNAQDFDKVSEVCWLATGEKESLAMQEFPQAMPFSQTYAMCCMFIRDMVKWFYDFCDGVNHSHIDLDEVLRKSLDTLLTDHVVRTIRQRLSTMNNLSLIAQVVINIEHFMIACDELEVELLTFRASQRGGPVKLASGRAFKDALSVAENRIDAVIASKLADFFELAEYNWVPRHSPSDNVEPSTYVFEMITFLTAYVDSVLIGLGDTVKTRAYQNALERINRWFMETLCSRDVPRYNEAALKMVFADVAFIETEVARLNKPGLERVFDEVKQTLNIVLSDAVQPYTEASIRRISYAAVKQPRLATVLTKLAAAAQASGQVARAERRRAEAETVSRLR